MYTHSWVNEKSFSMTKWLRKRERELHWSHFMSINHLRICVCVCDLETLKIVCNLHKTFPHLWEMADNFSKKFSPASSSLLESREIFSYPHTHTCAKLLFHNKNIFRNNFFVNIAITFNFIAIFFIFKPFSYQFYSHKNLFFSL